MTQGAEPSRPSPLKQALRPPDDSSSALSRSRDEDRRRTDARLRRNLRNILLSIWVGVSLMSVCTVGGGGLLFVGSTTGDVSSVVAFALVVIGIGYAFVGLAHGLDGLVRRAPPGEWEVNWDRDPWLGDRASRVRERDELSERLADAREEFCEIEDEKDDLLAENLELRNELRRLADQRRDEALEHRESVESELEWLRLQSHIFGDPVRADEEALELRYSLESEVEWLRLQPLLFPDPTDPPRT